MKYLRDWVPTSKSIPDMLEELYIDMYERGIIEKKDIEFIQLWIIDLYSVGYAFYDCLLNKQEHDWKEFYLRFLYQYYS